MPCPVAPAPVDLNVAPVDPNVSALLGLSRPTLTSS